jgi:hypothetical protein
MPFFRFLRIEIHSRNALFKNGWLAVFFLTLIVLSISLIHLFQSLYYQYKYPQAAPSTLHPKKITGITRDFVFDLSGSEASGYGDPMKLFDEDADPANGILTNAYSSPLPYSRPWLFFPKDKGLRIVIDLRVPHALSDVYWYDKSPESDSVWLYSGDMQHWKEEIAYKTIGLVAGWGWKNFHVPASTRYLMIRFKSFKSVLSELVLYGTPEEKILDSPAATIPAPLLPAPTLREFAGTNSYDPVPPALMKAFHQIRSYQLMQGYDRDTVHAYPNNQLSLNDAGLPKEKQWRWYLDSLQKLSGNKLWMSLRGIPLSMMNKGFKEQDKPVTIAGMDTEDPLSYGRQSRTFWNMAALFGKTAVDTNLIDVNDVPRFSGLGLMDRIENGNEEDGWWTDFYWTPMDYFAISNADYDGAEGRLGPKHGIKNADPDFQLMTSGMIQFDTSRVKTLKFLCEQLRADKKFIWEGGVQYHYYSNNAVNNFKAATKGLSPEADRLREKLAKVRAEHNRVLPGIPLILGENGYDRKQTSWQNTPLLPGYNEGQSQGIMIIRAMIAAFMSGFDGYNQYMMRSATNDENAPGTFATSGMIGGPANDVIYPAWYYWSTVINWLGDYQPDAVVSESGSAWIYRLRSKTNPASIAYVLVSPTTNGSILKNFRLKPEGQGYQSFTEIKLKDDDVNGSIRTGKLNNGFIELELGESPVIIMLGN